MSPPSKLTPQAQAQIEQLVRAGTSVEIAAMATGVSTTTFYRWMAQGKRARPGAATREFYDAIQRARAEAESVLVARIAQAAGKGSWAAAAWLLERRFPERWRLKPAEQPAPVTPDRADDDPFAEVIDLAHRRSR